MNGFCIHNSNSLMAVQGGHSRTTEREGLSPGVGGRAVGGCVSAQWQSPWEAWLDLPKTDEGPLYPAHCRDPLALGVPPTPAWGPQP